MEWTQETTLKFIELYREEEVLWNSKYEHYYNKIIKNDAWEKIVNDMGVPSEELKRKMTVKTKKMK